MGYKLLGMLVWNGGKWFTRRKVGSSSTGQRVGFVAGLAAATAAFLFVLSRKADDDE
jgi:ammonia channel protein AmtB